MKRIHPKTLANVRKVADNQRTQKCSFLIKSTTPTSLGVAETKVPYEVPDLDSLSTAEQKLWDHLGYIEGDYIFPCSIQSMRTEDLKSLNVSLDKRGFLGLFPAWVVEIGYARKHDGHTKDHEIFTTGGWIRLYGTFMTDENSPMGFVYEDDTTVYDDYEVEQIMTSGKNRSHFKAILTRRQDR